MIAHKNFPLRECNTLRVEANAACFIEFYNNKDILDFFQSEYSRIQPIQIIGSGSNLLFTSDFDGLIIRSGITGIETIDETETHVFLKSGSGVVWDELVAFCAERNLGGIENLSDIPGLVGAAPVQNIGAYGAEAADCIHEVIAWDLSNQQQICLSNTECKFGYRSSVFKEPEYSKMFISHVVFKLAKAPVLNTNYAPIEAEFSKFSSKNILNLRQAIINIRRSKLPGTNELPSAGSFFKNPVISSSQAETLIAKYPNIPAFKQSEKLVKIPAAWLIEQAGLKGIRHGNVGTYEKQPLVIVNYENAKGEEIVNFSKFIQEKVMAKFNILLEPEVCFI